MFAEIGCGPLCRVNPLTDRGKRFQLFKILCLTVIPILGVWGFTMYSLSDSVESKTDIEVAKNSMSIVVVLGRLIHRLQMERDMSVLYLSDLGPGTKTFLLAEYMATDDALEKLTIWPGALQRNPREQFRSKVNLMSYIAQHRTSLNPKKVDLYEEINFYSDITREFLEWLVENIKGSGFGATWKTLVAYQKITRCKEDIGVERAYGAMFYTIGMFPRWIDFEFYNDQVHDFKYNYKTAVFYSDIVVPLLMEEVKEIKSTGINITVTVNAYRYEIQYHDLNVSYKSEEKTKWFFDNMTEYLDSLLMIQEKVASRITEEVEEVLKQVITKVVIYASMVVVVIAMCPVIMFSSEALASDIQRYTQTLVAKTKELNLEKHKTDTLLYQMVPKSIAERLKNSSAVESEFFRSVTIFFSGISGFNQVCAECSPIDLVKILNSLYTAMDEQIGNYDVYKVETINDCYMVASGLPNRNGEKHVSEIASMAIDVLHMSRNKQFPSEHTPIQLQIGINTGSVSAGIVGTVMLRYCLFGDTVNIASRMNSYGLPNRIHISDNTYLCLKKTGKYKMKLRGNMDIKGKGRMDTYWLIDRMYGGTGGPNDEDYSKDRLVNEDAYNVTRPTEQNLGEHEVPIRVSATSYYPPLMKGMATLADDKKKNRKNVAAKI
ncbi:uncharacterized protein LOC132716182 isoform X2 [Ruditapes philippinarum]|uniref:uncharacterized protein LOC132716182 isoform X2 n=1 Tax=Ruditapes philippinarum TaxID=129788 RepID=UPI00295B949E|nr:uncharacterized protein LOC132716182 isoform X2 [Ruditapes philippinarum]